MSANSLVTNEDRQRGWSEFEVNLTDGSRECVRVHALERSDCFALATLSPADALTEALIKSLRTDAAFVARIGPAQQVAIMVVQAVLAQGDDKGRAGVTVAAAATIKLRRAGAWPASTVAMRDCIAECAANVAPFKAALQGLMQSSKIPPLPKL